MPDRLRGAEAHEGIGQLGVASLEQCSVAIRQQETRAQDVLPEIKVIGNSWISLMAYQSQGYAYIRP